ncbi:MAG: aminotransferase class V-fold PLP-dependent enzyme [Ignavibacteria bacterium]|nr:aminotransferase class V-fold PLP-dependent enzyme [Ignavibacteria bacterium]
MTSPAITRRGFIRTATGGMIGGTLLYAFPEGSRARYILADEEPVPGDDEHFWNVVRGQFPLRTEPVFLNNGTIGPSPFVVIDAVTAELESVDRDARYGGWEDVRPKIARFVHADPEEISITHNVTDGINVVACGLPLKNGDEVIMTDQEHAGNAVPWLARARRDGIVIRVISPGWTAAETLERINDAINSRTRVIAVPHITCTTGQVLPAREISTLGHDKGLWVMIDAAHTPGMLPLDVHAIGCDFLTTCGHKWMLGPKGTGFLYIRKDVIGELEPYWVGAGVDTGWDLRAGTITYRDDAHRFDFATQSSALYVGLGAAIDFLYNIGMENVSRRGQALAGRLRGGLRELGERVEILTPDEPGGYGSVVAFRPKNIAFDTLQQSLLNEHRFVTRQVPENGMNCNRISTHIYNVPAEVDRFLEAVRRLV